MTPSPRSTVEFKTDALQLAFAQECALWARQDGLG